MENAKTAGFIMIGVSIFLFLAAGLADQQEANVESLAAENLIVLFAALFMIIGLYFALVPSRKIRPLLFKNQNDHDL